MYIQEAIKARTPKEPFITRRSWSAGFCDGPVAAIVPTNTPEGCIIVSHFSRKGPSRGWQPHERDLIADDWEVCSGTILLKDLVE